MTTKQLLCAALAYAVVAALLTTAELASSSIATVPLGRRRKGGVTTS